MIDDEQGQHARTLGGMLRPDNRSVAGVRGVPLASEHEKVSLFAGRQIRFRSCSSAET